MMGDSDSDTENSVLSDEGKDLTVSEAKGILRDIMTLCERQPHRKKLAEARVKAKELRKEYSQSAMKMASGLRAAV